MSYVLDKRIWTAADFDQMGWHDACIHAFGIMAETFELLFDIDYVLRWVDPTPPATQFSFWVAPATLVFHDVSSIEVYQSSSLKLFTLLELRRQDEQLTPNKKMTSWLWTLDGDQGNIRFRATGYTQHFRKRPIHTSMQSLTSEQRGGLSFDRTP